MVHLILFGADFPQQLEEELKEGGVQEGLGIEPWRPQGNRRGIRSPEGRGRRESDLTKVPVENLRQESRNRKVSAESKSGRLGRNRLSVLAGEWKSDAPLLFSGSLFFDVVVRNVAVTSG